MIFFQSKPQPTMKKLLIAAIFILGCQKISYAQCSNPFYQFKEGTKVVMQGYDNKDKKTVKTISTFKNVEKTADGYKADVHYELYDKKDKAVSEGDYNMTCKNGTIELDMTGMIPAQSMEMLKNYEVEVKMDELEMPDKLEVGQKLKDASVHITTKNSPINIKLDMDITDRVVEGKQSVATPVGTFDCFKITYNTHMKVLIMNDHYKTVEYVAPKVGVVRTESLKDNGKMIGYTMLTTYQP